MLAVVTYGSSAVSVLFGNGDGTFEPAQNFSSGFQSISLAVADVNDDGLPDLLVANFGLGNVDVLLGKHR